MTTGEGHWVGELVVAATAYLPAILAGTGVALALYGAWPRGTVVAWVLVGWAAIVMFLGELLGLPDWLAAVSPLWHTPAVPAGEVAATPLLVLGAIAVALVGVGFVGFCRRDLGR